MFHERIDKRVGDVSRGLASGHSRRSFLARAGQFGVALAGAGIVETVMAPAASAHHVCGHTGTVGTCAGNSTCPAGTTQGGCWAACGCCVGNAVRQLCDCCVTGTTSGYCPSGKRVSCITYKCQTIGC